jgi:hypothetical protein
LVLKEEMSGFFGCFVLTASIETCWEGKEPKPMIISIEYPEI